MSEAVVEPTQPQRKNGRPKSTSPTSGVTLWLSAEEQDLLYDFARRNNLSISKAGRKALILVLKGKRQEE